VVETYTRDRRKLIGTVKIRIKNEFKVANRGSRMNRVIITEYKCTNLNFMSLRHIGPSKRNSVLALLKHRRFEVIQSAMEATTGHRCFR